MGEMEEEEEKKEYSWLREELAQRSGESWGHSGSCRCGWRHLSKGQEEGSDHAGVEGHGMIELKS